MIAEKSRPFPHEIQHKFMQIDRLHRCAAEKLISLCGVHRSQHRLLMYLCMNNTAPTQKDIADRFEISPAAVAASLKKLEADGYIIRRSNESDSRENFTDITAKGRQVVEYSKEAFDELDRKTFDGLTAEEQAELYRLLNKIIVNLKKANEER